MYNTTGGGTLLPYTMVTGGYGAAAVSMGMTTELKINIYSFYYVLIILHGLPKLQLINLQTLES